MPETVFQESAAKVAIGFFSQIKFFENTAFGHVTEVPTWNFHQTLVLVLDFKKYNVEFADIFACLLLWSPKRKRKKRNSKFDGP